jgi:DNA repair protein RadC
MEEMTLFDDPQDYYWVTTKLVREQKQPYRIGTPENARDIAIDYLDLENCDREHFVVAYLDTQGKINALCTISVGSMACSVVHPREVFKPAILASAASIILIHNHPSGDPTPSQTDIETTQRLVKAGELLGITVLDHIIVGGNNYISLKSEGAM